MRNKSFERLYQESAELTPRDTLKNDILAQAKQELSTTHVRDESKKRVRRRRKIWAPLVSCFAAIAILFGTFFGFYHENYQTVYVDVNPSVALEINRFGQVNDVDYLNEDAKTALKGIKLKGKKAENALEKIINAYEKAGYFEVEADLFISAVAKNKKTDKLLEKLGKHADKLCIDLPCSINLSKCTKEEQHEAMDKNLSPGKYKLISEILKYFPNLTEEDLRDQSMKYLKDLLATIIPSLDTDKEPSHGEDKYPSPEEDKEENDPFNGEENNPSHEEDKGPSHK